MKKSTLKACGISCIVLLFILASSMVMATDTGEEPPKVCDPGICIDLVYECTDTPVGAPFQTRGVVTNCGPQKFDEVFVKDLVDATVEPPVYILSPFTLDPGASVEFFSDFVSDECPAVQSAVVEARVYDTGAPCRVKAFADATCDCLTLDDTCRTPGFWGTHAGMEKDEAFNITQMVIDAAPAGIMVCGEVVDNTSLMTAGSALEAMCVHPRGEQLHQLARHLTAAALNCVVSGSGMDCDGTSIEAMFNSCNSVCMAGVDDQAITDCGLEIDCWNNGGTMLDTGMCQLGTCSETGEACEEDLDCGYNLDGGELTCIPFTDTCHDRPLVNDDLGLDFDPPGPAGSSKACNDAIKNDIYFLD